MNFLCVLAALLSLFCYSVHAIDDYRLYAMPMRRHILEEQDYVKRMMPKERRAPSEIEDMSSFMRSLDGIQKPRFG